MEQVEDAHRATGLLGNRIAQVPGVGKQCWGEEHTARMHSALHFLVQQIFSVRVSCLYR